MWEEDLERMLAHGIKTIRIGEFAWSKVEPREGEFTFEFFDEFLKVVAKTDMKVNFWYTNSNTSCMAYRKNIQRF